MTVCKKGKYYNVYPALQIFKALAELTIQKNSVTGQKETNLAA